MTTDAKQLSLALTAPFPVEAVRFKPSSVNGNRALAAAYLDARAIMQRLDSVFGVGGWKDAYQLVNGGSVVCTLSLKVDGELREVRAPKVACPLAHRGRSCLALGTI